MLPEITSIVRRVFPDAHLLRVSTPREQIAAEMMRERMGARLFSWFAVVAIGLSVVGIWGLVAYSVAARTHEMAVRLALGASAGQLVRSIAWRGLLPVVVGAAVGLATAAAGQRLVAAFLFDVRPLRVLLFAGSALLVLAVAAVAALLPARRLLRLDPAQTLRSE
jgi:ABC-type antimicrobial peptide transport system permease subunit